MSDLERRLQALERELEQLRKLLQEHDRQIKALQAIVDSLRA